MDIIWFVCMQYRLSVKMYSYYIRYYYMMYVKPVHETCGRVTRQAR